MEMKRRSRGSLLVVLILMPSILQPKELQCAKHRYRVIAMSLIFSSAKVVCQIMPTLSLILPYITRATEGIWQ